MHAFWDVELHDFQKLARSGVPLFRRLLKQRGGLDVALWQARSEAGDDISPITPVVDDVGLVGTAFEIETSQFELGLGIARVS